jgi:5-methyltetrahydrofolate--homocysteine methyltransferase
VITIAEQVNQGRTLLSDGAWGTLLLKKGLTLDECPEMWCLTHRPDVLEIARSYVEAGADAIQTNSFGASRVRLSRYDLADRALELNEAAAAISREAAGPDRHVLGSIGPTALILATSEIGQEEVYGAFREQAIGLERGGADAVCIETMSALDEACLAIRAAREGTHLEIICTFTFERTASGEYRTMAGVSPTQMARAVIEAGAQVIGANCGNGMAQMIDIVQELRAAAPKTSILVHANAGLPVFRDGLALYPESPEEMALLVPELLRAGANVIGGCCGTTPEHIRAFGRALGR